MRLYRASLRHNTLIPLLFIACFVAGIAALFDLNKQLWPTYQVSHGVVSIAWEDAPVAAVDREISTALDAALNSVAGITNVSTTSANGMATAFFKIEISKDDQTIIRDVEQSVRAITGLPLDARPAIVRLLEPTDSIARLKVSGPFDATAADALSAEVIAKLNANGVTRIRKITPSLPARVINVDQSDLKKHGLTAQEVEQKVAAYYSAPETFSLQSETTNQTVEIRKRDSASFVGDLILKNTPTTVRLSDIAEIGSRSNASGAQPVFREGNGFFLQIERSSEDDLLEVSAAIQQTITELQAELPPTILFELFDIQADSLEERIGLLAENALAGIVLVFFALLIGVGLMPAIWVSVGVVTSFFLGFLLMQITGQSINYVSVFAMIMVIGILVDDAIVVAERIDFETRQDSEGALIRAVGVTWRPVLVSTVTTIFGFAPILILQDSIGAYVAAIPFFVCVALAASYVECFVFMPHHMRNYRPLKHRFPDFGMGRMMAFMSFLALGLVKWAVKVNRMSAVVLSLLVLAGTATLLVVHPGKFTFWLNPQTKVVMAYVTLPQDASYQQVEDVLENIWAGVDEVVGAGDPTDKINATFGVYGIHLLKPNQDFNPALGTVFVELNRNIGEGSGVADFVRDWQAAVDKIGGDALISIGQQQIGLEGSDFEIRVSHPDLDTLRSSAEALVAELQGTAGFSNISNSMFGGNTGILIAPNSYSQTAGLASPEQIEQSVLQSLRQTRGQTPNASSQRDWILRFGDAQSPFTTLLNSPLNASSDAVVGDVVSIEQRPSVTPITRREGALTAVIQTDYSSETRELSDVREDLENRIFPNLTSQFGTDFSFSGAIQVQDDTLRSVIVAFVLALVLMFSTLAVSFGDYRRPVIVLVSLPTGIAAGLVGHIILDYPITLLSLVAFLGLSGILVNDLVLLIDAYDSHRRRGLAQADAIVSGFKERLRAIALTSLTTTLGLLPLMLDKTSEATFLIPIAISVVFGLAITMLLNLIFFPWVVIALLGDERTQADTSMAHI